MPQTTNPIPPPVADGAVLSPDVLRLLEEYFPDENSIRALLSETGYPVGTLPGFNSARGFWAAVVVNITRGAYPSPTPIVRAALDRFPYNPVLGSWVAAATAPPAAPVIVNAQPAAPPPAADPVADRAATGFLISVTSPRPLQEVHDAALRALRVAGINTPLELGLANDTFVTLILPRANSDQAIQAAARLAAELGLESRRVTVRANNFRDYYFERLLLEGPDQRRFEATNVPASTSAGEMARGVMHNYYRDNNWPTGKNGKPQEAVVTQITPDGKQERLLGDRSLHENRVRNGAVLQVAPQVTAGVNPVQREEALAKVQAQVMAYAGAHRGFKVRANATQKPTSYRLEFDAPGFAPADGPGPPRPADHHVVRIDLGPEFSMQAPLVTWQTPVFHPNIDPKYGKVCLGILEENYRPGLDFGVLLQMLVDIAGYQNYEVENGYNTDALDWARTLDGQVAIEARGGKSILREMLNDKLREAYDPPPLRIRELG